MFMFLLVVLSTAIGNVFANADEILHGDVSDKVQQRVTMSREESREFRLKF